MRTQSASASAKVHVGSSAAAERAIAGLVPCGPFGDYRASPDNTFMTLRL
jgi:hypothetical protein